MPRFVTNLRLKSSQSAQETAEALKHTIMIPDSILTFTTFCCPDRLAGRKVAIRSSSWLQLLPNWQAAAWDVPAGKGGGLLSAFSVLSCSYLLFRNNQRVNLASILRKNQSETMLFSGRRRSTAFRNALLSVMVIFLSREVALGQEAQGLEVMMIAVIRLFSIARV